MNNLVFCILLCQTLLAQKNDFNPSLQKVDFSYYYCATDTGLLNMYLERARITTHEVLDPFIQQRETSEQINTIDSFDTYQAVFAARISLSGEFNKDQINMSYTFTQMDTVSNILGTLNELKLARNEVSFYPTTFWNVTFRSYGEEYVTMQICQESSNMIYYWSTTEVYFLKKVSR